MAGRENLDLTEATTLLFNEYWAAIKGTADEQVSDQASLTLLYQFFIKASADTKQASKMVSADAQQASKNLAKVSSIQNPTFQSRIRHVAFTGMTTAGERGIIFTITI